MSDIQLTMRPSRNVLESDWYNKYFVENKLTLGQIIDIDPNILDKIFKMYPNITYFDEDTFIKLVKMAVSDANSYHLYYIYRCGSLTIPIIEILLEYGYIEKIDNENLEILIEQNLDMDPETLDWLLFQGINIDYINRSMYTPEYFEIYRNYNQWEPLVSILYDETDVNIISKCLPYLCVPEIINYDRSSTRCKVFVDKLDKIGIESYINSLELVTDILDEVCQLYNVYVRVWNLYKNYDNFNLDIIYHLFYLLKCRAL